MKQQPIQQAQPTPNQALTLLAQVAAAFQGNLEQHQNIQQAIAILDAAINPVKKEKAPKASSQTAKK